MTDKTELARDRTDLAEDRTLLAIERTFAGWMRTGMAAVGIGLGLNALFQAMQPAWVPKAIATAFVTIALLIFYLAERRASAVLARLNAHEVQSVGRADLRLMAWLLSTATVALIAAMWLLRIE